VIKVGIVLIIAFIAVAIINDIKAPEKTRWFVCAKDEQCVVINGACGWTAANKKYANDAQKFQNWLKDFVKCAPGGYPEPQPPAVCVQNKCVVSVSE